jgi:hypothetical protein
MIAGGRGMKGGGMMSGVGVAGRGKERVEGTLGVYIYIYIIYHLPTCVYIVAYIYIFAYVHLIYIHIDI